MVTLFNYNSEIQDIQNRLISQQIRNSSNTDLLKSESAVRAVIQSYIDKFRATGEVLTLASKYVVESKDVIKISQFNDLFESIFIDLNTLYTDLEIVDRVLILNQDRNKYFFGVIKKRIRDLWNRLNLTRSQIYDKNPGDESYYESFSTDINAKLLKNILIDKKSGYLQLSPIFSRTHNKNYELKKITSNTYPAENHTGGVFYTTNTLNTFDDNYSIGSKDMLQNGLWKEEILCSDIPKLLLDIGDNVSIKRNYKGVVSIIDIDYKYPVEMNRLDLDIFGDKPLLVDTVLYKSTSSNNWTPLISKLNALSSESRDSIIRGRAFDVITFRNISRVLVSKLRIVINQENYIFQDSKSLDETSLDNKINKDLSERRYEVIKFGSNLDDNLSKPVNDENTSLYSKLIEIAESTYVIDEMLEKIESLLIPSSDILSYDFKRVTKFEMGLWSIEPKIEHYTNLVGVFDSKPYEILDKSLISISLISSQDEPLSTTCNWYINYNSTDIPIVENDTSVRKEPINIIDMRSDSHFNSFYPGTFIRLDFPVDSNLPSNIQLSENGSAFTDIRTDRVVFLNSTLLFLPDMNDPYKARYVIKYPLALYSSVGVYVLSKKEYKNDLDPFHLGIVSTEKRLLEVFINTVKTSNNILSNYYRIKGAVATIEETKKWFGEKFLNSIFVANSLLGDLTNYNTFDDILTSDVCKGLTTRSYINSYLNGTNAGYSDLGIDSGITNTAPSQELRRIS